MSVLIWALGTLACFLLYAIACGLRRAFHAYRAAKWFAGLCVAVALTPRPAHAQFTCDDVNNAVMTKPAAQVAALIRNATDEQVAGAVTCLRSAIIRSAIIKATTKVKKGKK